MFRICQALTLTALLCAPAHGQCGETRLSSYYAPSPGAQFGYSVAAGSDTILAVGSPGQVVPGRGETGAVTVYRRQLFGDWAAYHVGVPGSVAAFDRFGESVALDSTGDYLAVGAPYNDVSANQGGAVYLFRWNFLLQSYTLEREYHGTDAGGLLGHSLDMHGGLPLLAAGAPYAGSQGQGMAFVYRRGGSGWTTEASLTGSQASDGFGWDVALDGDHLLIGAPFTDVPGNPTADWGSIHFHRLSGGSWGLVNSFGQPQPDVDGHFGSVIDLLGDRLITGVPDDGASDEGRYVLWQLQGDLWSPSSQGPTGSQRGQRLGSAVVARVDDFLVGTSGESSLLSMQLGPGAGSVLQAPWTLLSSDFTLWSANDVAEFDGYGSALDSFGDLILVGAPGKNGGQGQAYLYDLSVRGAVTNLGQGLPGTGGVEPRLDFEGPLCGRTSFVIRMTDLRPFTSGILVFGATALNTPFKAGVLVPQLDVLVPVLTFDGGAAARLMWSPERGAVEFYSQLWVVDPEAVRGLAASNAVRVNTVP